MKTIHFDNNRNPLWALIVILAIVLMLLGIFKVYEYQQPRINKLVSAVGFVLMTSYLSKMFWYKNYVQWNKKGMVIRIKSLLGKTLRFRTIKHSELHNTLLSITKKDNTKVVIDLSGIVHTDVIKLNNIMQDHIKDLK